jgi:threonine synthase
LLYRSTRSEAAPVPAHVALLRGLAPDGGLYVPVDYPRLDPWLLDLSPLSYSEIAYRVLSPYLPSLPGPELHAALAAAAARFESPEVAPLAKAGELRLLELFRGPTLAFKDLALTVFGSLLSMARKAEGLSEGLLVLVATSGDTGKAALAGLEDTEGIRVAVFYPADGVSEIQRLMMTTHAAPNALVIGLRGNFDAAQRGVKAIFVDEASGSHEEAVLAAAVGASSVPGASFTRLGWRLSSANSINIGRLLPQVAYYVAAYRAMRALGELRDGEALDVVVPTGNFGDVLAAWIAKRMGLPLGRLVVASNRNRVLADFLSTGRYDRNRPFYTTTSPSMDILVSSNLERLLFEASGRDSSRIASLMALLSERGAYSLSAAERSAISDFLPGSAGEDEAAAEIKRVFEETGYLMDTHTATAAAVLRGIHDEECSARPTVVVATASPFKFPGAVARALGLAEGRDELDTAERLAARAHLSLPSQIASLRGADERHTRVVSTADMAKTLRSWLESSPS